MKREMINLSYCIAGTMLCGLLAFSACDRMEENAGNGEKTEVRFTLGNVDSWGAETSLRGASETSRTVETAS
ncbi:MAG: hypothetical protein LBS46_08105, partial [Dysgonamonadaceae bacterium]|nr:hypothetical protein [Dysgonamonadaceae bacterium]